MNYFYHWYYQQLSSAGLVYYLDRSNGLMKLLKAPMTYLLQIVFKTLAVCGV